MSVPLTVTSSSPNSPPGQAALGLVAGIPSKAPTSSPLAAEDLLVQLQNAISSGNEEQAQFLALQLAKQKTKVSISPKEAALQQQKDRVVRVKIYVEDRQRTGSFIFMNLNPAMKFEDLKKKMLIEYGFPPEVQVWIVGQRIARDTDTLDKRDINKPGASMHLYLRSAESVGLTPHDYRIKYGHLLPSDLSSARVSAANEPIRNQPRTASPIVNLSSQPASSPSYLQREIHRPIAAEVSPIAKYGGDRAPPRASPIRDVHPATMPRDRRSRNLEDISRQSGWACSACTYINIPTRPGCEICGTDRPATYRIPEKIELPLSERLRLDREKEYERMMQELQAVQMREVEVRQSSPFGGGMSRDVETERRRLQHRREEELHNMLQLNDQINSFRTRFPGGDLPRNVLEDICRLESQMDEGIKVLRRLQHQEEDIQKSGLPRQTYRRFGDQGDGVERSDSDSDEGQGRRPRPEGQGREVHVYWQGRDSKDKDGPQITIGDGNVTYVGQNEPQEGDDSEV